MVKRFFSRLLTSFLGAWLALVLFGVLVVVVIIGLFASSISKSMSEQGASVSKNSVLVIDMSGVIEETRTAKKINYQDLLLGGPDETQSLDVITLALQTAAENKNIKMVYLKGGSVAAAPATLNALRDAVVDFKQKSKGKKVIAYADNYSQGSYYVASVADEIYLNPQGGIDLTGIGGSVPYYKGLLDKVGVSFQVAKVGTFKSAVEPYILEHMSEPARAQLDTLYGVMWNYITDQISDSRKIKSQKINTLVDSCFFFASNDVVEESGLITKLMYEREINDMIADATDKEKVEDINFVKPEDVIGVSPWNNGYNSKNQVAVLYAVGEIAEHSDGIDCFKLVPEIIKLADDENVKALVMRVNSPGGSVFGSQQIAEALSYFQSKGKTFVVSMGDYAASGGYWISADADRIFANPLTITGSIGIFGLFPNCYSLTQKLGVNFESVATNPNGMLNIPFKPLNEVQMMSAQDYINRGYDQFIDRVAKGRKMSPAKVRVIAEGRVWNALTAKKIGLVDQIGSLQDAIEWAANKAGLGDNYDAPSYPKYEPGFWDKIPTSNFAAGFSQFTSTLSPLSNEVSQESMFEIYRILSREQTLALMPEIKFVF